MSRISEDLPQKVVDAFSDRSTLTLPQLAPLIGKTVPQLKGLVAAGAMPYHVKGTGSIRTHYVFTLADVRRFYASPEEPNIFEIPEPVDAVEPTRKRSRPRNRRDNVPSKPRQPGFVYFVTDGQFVKIGWATDWRQRLIAIQTANPNKLQVLAVCRGSTYHELALHRRFEKHHTQGEWHRLDQEIVDYVAEVGRKGLNCLSEAQ